MGDVVQALCLGLLQGLTEFLPVSSDGHLALAQLWLHVAEPSLALTVLLHLGTLVATVLYFRRRIGLMIRDAWLGLRHPRAFLDTPGGRDVVTVVLASIPTALLGLLFRHEVEELATHADVVGGCLLLTAAWLISTLWAPRGERSDPTPWGALLIGLAQGAAILPGLSRSAGTIAVGLWLGLRGSRAFELSMLMSVPAVFGAILLEGSSLVGDKGARVLELGLSGAVVAFVSGLIALAVLGRVVAKGRLALFALWVVPLAALAFAWHP